MAKRWLTLLLTTTMFTASCFPGRFGRFRLFEAALITAVIVSAVRPPPPRVVYVPEPRSGYVWQPGYWTRDRDDWVWVEGGWIEQRPAYTWSPTHWEEAPDGTWRLVPGQWIPERR
ncbi:MAG: YXWGXW repeat-containing protein [Polyangiales bacterium]